MYTAYYGFQEKPFNIISDPGFLYMSSKHRMALNYLEYGLMDGIGFILLTGEIGTGKTTLIRQLVKKIRGDVEVAVVFNTNVSAQELLDLILEELEVGRPQGGKASCLDALNQALIQKFAAGRRVLLIVDEAQNLSQEALEEIRMLSNLQTDKASLIQILLVGQPGLRARLQDPSLTQLSQRIAVSYHLRPLDLEETGAYIQHRLKIAGGTKADLFSADAVKTIHAQSGGIPRSINILCDAALVYGYADELDRIEAKVIDAVVSDREEMGPLSTLSPGGMAGPSAGHDPTDGSLAGRVESLEGQVGRLSTMVEWQIREMEGRAEHYKDKLVERLDAMLREERKRSDQLLAQCNVLRDRLQLRKIQSPGGKVKARVAATEKEPDKNAPTADGPVDGESPERRGRLRRWFGK